MSKEYYLYVNGQRVKVSEQIYKVYWREKEHEKIVSIIFRKFISSRRRTIDSVNNLSQIYFQPPAYHR